MRRSIPIDWLLWPAALAGLAWRFRERKPAMIAFAALAVIHPLLAFTGAKEVLALAGGVILEIAGAGACFYVVLGAALRREFERPLYALWGWWMLLNRGWESLLMLRSRDYWDSRKVYDSGLAAGLTNDLDLLRERLGVSHQAVLVMVLILAASALPAAWGLVAWRRAREAPHR